MLISMTGISAAVAVKDAVIKGREAVPAMKLLQKLDPRTKIVLVLVISTLSS